MWCGPGKICRALTCSWASGRLRQCCKLLVINQINISASGNALIKRSFICQILSVTATWFSCLQLTKLQSMVYEPIHNLAQSSWFSSIIPDPPSQASLSAPGTLNHSVTYLRFTSCPSLFHQMYYVLLMMSKLKLFNRRWRSCYCYESFITEKRELTQNTMTWYVDASILISTNNYN